MAVRCHERIARWHAMCEHQLSHIDDFAVMQSQQNIQELGQTMKTLNQYYDDALGRSVVEKPDEDGNETAVKGRASDTLAHGCSSNFVQGAPPADFNGTPLKSPSDETSLAARAIGKPNQHGTAEPEMSGLYILLTIDNDGGMEVLKYVAHLSRARPWIYKSRPVQLALSIYKAKKEQNYAKFFQILRDSSTPYLFGCIMFKHVAQMRKVAFQVMWRAYGGKAKDSNEPIYDHYPLRNLVRLLCFEDAEEALAACKHFGIKVRETKVRYSTGSKVEPIIFWKQGAFREPTDEDKGTTIVLRPWKMVRTIESKLDGATRLAVCRGEKSGEGSFMSDGQSQLGVTVPPPAALTNHDAQQLEAMVRAEKQRKDADESQKAEKQRREEEAAREQERALEMERKRQEQLRREQEAKERERRKIQAEREEAAKRKAEEAERARQERIAEMKRQEEAKRRAEEARKREEQLRLEAERKQQALEAQKREQARLEAERKKRKEEEKRRMEQERQRLLREAEARRIQEEHRRIERERQAEKERRLALEWSNRVNAAKKKLSLLRWMHKMPTYLQQFDENDAKLMHLGRNALEIEVPTRPLICPRNTPTELGWETRIRSVVESLLRKGLPKQIHPANLFSEAFVNSRDEGEFRTPFLYKVGVVLPDSESNDALALFALIQTWIGQALNFGTVDVGSSRGQFRVVIVDGNKAGAIESCDAALAVVPYTVDQPLSYTLSSLGHILKGDIPRVSLLLVEDLGMGMNHVFSEIEARLSDSSGEMFTLSNSDLTEASFCDSLATAIELAARECLKRKPIHLERYSIDSLCTACITNAIFSREYDRRDNLVHAARSALASLVDELDAIVLDDSTSAWPAADFADYSKQAVPNYFGEGADLPLNWKALSTRGSMENGIFCWNDRMKSDTFSDVLDRLLVGSPANVMEECKLMEVQRSYRRAFQVALMWRSQESEPWQNEFFVYLPTGTVEELIRTVGSEASDSVPLAPTRRMLDLEHRALVPTFANEEEATENFFSTSPKRPREEEAYHGDEAIAPVDTPCTEGAVPKKQRRSSSSRKKQTTMSKELSKSTSFTRHLQQLLAGDVLQDQMVGNRTLSSLLHGAPKPKRESVELID